MVIRYGFQEMKFQMMINLQEVTWIFGFLLVFYFKLSLKFRGFKKFTLFTVKQFFFICSFSKFFYWKLRSCYDFIMIWICRSLNALWLVFQNKCWPMNAVYLPMLEADWSLSPQHHVVRLLVRTQKRKQTSCKANIFQSLKHRTRQFLEAKCIVRAKEIMKTVVSSQYFPERR